jgi:hypothetical protein
MPLETGTQSVIETPFDAADGANVQGGPSTAVVLRFREAQSSLRMTGLV